MRSSMSCKGNGWDDAPTESLLGSLKVGRLHGRRFEFRRADMDEIVARLCLCQPDSVQAGVACRPVKGRPRDDLSDRIRKTRARSQP